MGLRFLALVCLVGAAFAGPVQRQSESRCAKECKPSQHSKFRYEPGRAYAYNYKVTNNVTTVGDQKQNANIEGIAEFLFHTHCEGILKIKNIRIQQRVSKEEKDDLMKKLELPLSYCFNDGKLGPVGPHPEESTQSLNMKKGILSSIVNEMSNFEESREIHERDSLGECRTKYTVQRNNGETVVKKTKDLKSCTNRHTIMTFLFKKKVPSSILFEGDHMICEQHISNKIIKTVKCRETEKLKTPLKDRNSLIEFSASIELIHRETKPTEKESWQEPVNFEEILYSIEEPRDGDRNLKEVKRVLKSLCSKNTISRGMTVGKDFVQLVSLVKSLRYQELKNTYESLKDGTLCSSKKVRDLFVDTLPFAPTDDAIQFMVYLLVNNEVTGLKSKLWPATLALKQKPTKHTMVAIAPLVKKDQSASTLIAVATLINRLCSVENCDDIPSVAEIVRVLNDNLGSQCSSDDENQILRSLRAFANMGYLGKASRNIIACARDSSKPIRIRIAAIDAFRRIEGKKPQELLDMYSDKKEDYQIRIACFESVFKHADKKQLKQIKEVAESETHEQVSGFVHTCIQSVNKTRSPLLKNLQMMLQDTEINAPKVDFLTNSKYMEFSTFNELFKAGGSIETNVIHAEQTKLPVSMRTRWDAYLFGHNVNVLEVGLRTDGLENFIQSLIALKEKIPKFEQIRDKLAQKPSLEELKDEFNHVFPKNVFGGSVPELSMFLRTLGIEFLGVSTSDLSGMKEILKIAELMTKMARGQDADFSHSIIFMSSKLVIPSVTGRSYSIDLTGSSTVGLTAKSKADLLKLPKNADIHLHFKPSVNLEISVTAGIQSNTHRPDVKHVSRLHLESDIEARAEVKDGHVAIMNLTMPSENIALAKMSTDVYEIDEDHNEKPIIQKRQKKFDQCFSLLSKPLGISACASVELPKPFVLETFPFFVPFGSGEIALKKSDNSFRSYVVRMEIPKQTGPNMRYSASFDTPGSSVSRRFAADLEVKQQGGQKDVLLKLVCPFKTVGGSASFTKNDELTRGSVKFFTSEAEIASANVTCKTMLSRSRKIYEVTGGYHILNQEPTAISVTVTDIKGRKHQMSFDMKANKPQSKPVAIKGTILKEGRIELSKKSEWKLSSEISVQSSVVDATVRSTIEKRSRQSQAISANFGIDYQREGKQKHSLTLSGTSQKSSGKVNTQVKLESTQYPRVNMYLTWDMQRESKESLKNDIKLKYGQNPETTFMHLKQKSSIPETGPGHCSATIQIPHRNIHYELSVTHEIDMSEKPMINIEADFCYNQDKHIKSVLDVKYESKSPLKASGKLELEYPGGHYIYEDEITQNGNVIEGNSKVQYKKGKVIQLHYKYRALSNDAKFHHEIESSIQTPSSRSPINGKASIELNSESLAIVGQVGSDYSVQAHLRESGESHISFQLPLIEGEIKSTEEYKKKTVDVDLKVKTRNPRHITGSAIVDLKDKKKVELTVYPDIDHAPKKKILVTTVVERATRNSKDIYTGATRLVILDLIDFSLAETGEISLFGDQECTLAVSIKKLDPLIVRFKRKTDKEHGNMVLAISKNNVEKAKMELDAKLKQTDSTKELSIETWITSQDQSFENMHMYMRNQVTRTGLSQNIQTTLSFKKNDKLYKTEWNSDIQPNGLEVKAQMQTPHVNYEKNAVGFSLQVSDTGVSSLVSISCLNDKKISIQTEIKTKKHGLSLTCRLETPFEISDVQLQLTLDNHHNKKSLEASVDANNARICAIQGKMSKTSGETQLEGSIKVSNLPKLKFQGLDVKIQNSPSAASVAGSIKLIKNREISLYTEIKKEGDVISTTTSIATPYKSFKDVKAHISVENQASKGSLLCYFDANGQRKVDVELSVASSLQVTEAKCRFKFVRTPEISADAKLEKTGKSFLISANVMKGTSPLLSTSLNRLSYQGGEKLQMKTKSFEDTLFEMEILKDVSDKNSNKYSLKLKGPFEPVSITFSKNYIDKNSVSAELRACGEVQSSPVCYSLKSSHKMVLNSGNTRFYQKITIDLEKSVGGSYSKAVGRLQVLMSAAENDYRSKMTVEVNEKRLAYELKLHSRQNENDRCSLDLYINLPKQTSRLRASIVHNHHRVHLEFDAIPSTDDPTRKLSFEVKKEINPNTQEVSGYIKMSHPRLSQPILLTCKLQRVGQYFVKGRLVIHSGPVWGKTLMIEIIPDIEQKAYGITSIEYRIYTEDKSLDANLKITVKSSSSEKKMGYEWNYVSHDVEKRGGMTVTLSGRSGGPKSFKISYYSPSADYEVQGSAAQGPEDINFSIASAGKTLREIRITTSDSCANIEVTKAGPLIKGQICVNKQEGRALHLLKVDVQYRQQKCIEIRVGVDPETPEYIDVVFKCSKEESCRALEELLSRELSLVRLSTLKQDVLRKVTQVKQAVVAHVTKVKTTLRNFKDDIFSKVKTYLRNLKDEIVSKVKSKINQPIRMVEEYIRKVKEMKEKFLNYIKHLIPGHVRETCLKYYQYYEKVAIRYYQRYIEIVSRHWSNICELGWYCGDIKSALRRIDVNEVKILIERKVNELKQSLKFRIQRFRLIYPSEIVNFIKNGLEKIHQVIVSEFGRIVGDKIFNEIRKYGTQLESFIRQKVIDGMDAVIKKIHDIIFNDEDLRTAQKLILKAKEEIVKAWRNKEKIAESSVKRIELDMKRDLKKIVDEQVMVLKYDPKEGDFRFKVRQPLSKSQIESMKQRLHQLLSEFRVHLNR